MSQCRHVEMLAARSTKHTCCKHNPTCKHASVTDTSLVRAGSFSHPWDGRHAFPRDMHVAKTRANSLFPMFHAVPHMPAKRYRALRPRRRQHYKTSTPTANNATGNDQRSTKARPTFSLAYPIPRPPTSDSHRPFPSRTRDLRTSIDARSHPRIRAAPRGVRARDGAHVAAHGE
jgi:hypothetical protein